MLWTACVLNIIVKYKNNYTLDFSMTITFDWKYGITITIIWKYKKKGNKDMVYQAELDQLQIFVQLQQLRLKFFNYNYFWLKI